MDTAGVVMQTPATTIMLSGIQLIQLRDHEISHPANHEMVLKAISHAKAVKERKEPDVYQETVFFVENEVPFTYTTRGATEELNVGKLKVITFKVEEMAEKPPPCHCRNVIDGPPFCFDHPYPPVIKRQVVGVFDDTNICLVSPTMHCVYVKLEQLLHSV